MKLGMRNALFALIAGALAFTGDISNAAPAQSWVGSWATAENPLLASDMLDPGALHDATLRQIVRVSVGGDTIRIRLSNAFGTAPLRIAGVHAARAVAAGNSAIVPATDHTVTFDGCDDVIIPPGAEYTSDPIALSLPTRADLAITLRLETPPATQTGHPGSRTTSFLIAGHHLSDTDLPGATKIDHWYLISAVDVVAPKTSAIAVIGDSITDGRGSTTNGNDRWPDQLSERLNTGKGPKFGVLNFGIGGNRILDDGLGPNALARFTRDVLGQSGVKALIVFEGVNDLGGLTRLAPANAAEHAVLVARLIGAYRQIVDRARRHGIKAIGATITPYGGAEYYHPDAVNEADRQAINAWIRTKGNFDAVVDFDLAMRDPAHPENLLPIYDCGDHLHPSPVGFKAMANAIPPSLFKP